ncbi:hypothetical protein FKM82_018773 [Ascaphus truei]
MIGWIYKDTMSLFWTTFIDSQVFYQLIKTGRLYIPHTVSIRQEPDEAYCETRCSLPELIERGTQPTAGHPVQIPSSGSTAGRASESNNRGGDRIGLNQAADAGQQKL